MIRVHQKRIDRGINMDNQYINELLEKLENTEVWYNKTPQIKYQNYNNGIQLIVDYFHKHKEKTSTIVFYWKWRKFSNCKSYDSRFYEKWWNEHI